MEFFTALIVTYTLDTNNVRFMDQEHHAVIWFETEKQCEQALRMDEFFDVIYQDSKDVHISCMKSERLSQSIKPRLRP